MYPVKEFLFEKVDQLTGAFTLPVIPTTIVSEKDIYNLGYVVIQPTIYITNNGIISGTQTEEYGFEVLNETLNQKVRLNYHTTEGEVVKIDVYNREITSNLRGI